MILSHLQKFVTDLDVDGFVSEGSGQNVFLVHKGVLSTPTVASSILGGITRKR